MILWSFAVSMITYSLRYKLFSIVYKNRLTLLKDELTSAGMKIWLKQN